MKKLIFVIVIFCFHFQLIGQNDTFSKQELADDLKHLVKTLENVHPDIYAYSKDKLNISELESKFKDGMTAREFALTVSPYVIKLNDGHTKITIPTNGGRESVFPLKVKFIGKKIFAIQNIDKTEFPVGVEILSINGISSKEILQKFTEYINGEEISYRLGLAEMYFSYYAWSILDFKGEFEIVFIDKNGSERTEVVKGIPMNIVANNYPSYGNSFKLLDNSIAYLKVSSFNNSSKAFEEYLQGIFKEISEKGVSNLIIDIRNNDGGNVQLANILFSYIYDKPFVPFSKYEIKASKEYKNYLNENSVWSDIFLAPSYSKYVRKVRKADENSIITFEEKETKPTKKYHFSGKVYLLINSNSYSTSNTFATMFYDYKVGEIWGKPSGGLATTFSDRFDFSLPNTKLNCSVSSQKYYRPIIENGNGPILPDREVTITVEDCLNDYDRQLELLLKTIKEK